MIPIVFFSHDQQRCGVYQFGRQIFEALQTSKKFDFIYCEVRSPADIQNAMSRFSPQAVLINWHPITFGWAEGWPLWSLQVPVIGIMHEMSEATANRTDDTQFDYYILHDPSANFTNPLVFGTGRLIHSNKTALPPPSRITIGSIGFAGSWKNFEGLVARANAEFDNCLIRLNIPFSYYIDNDGSGARSLAQRCRSLVTKPRNEIEVTHEFMSLHDTIAFLAANSLNGFFYEIRGGQGISSAVDLALAARRPIALKRDTMTRHLSEVRPSVFIEDRSLAEILKTGVAPLVPCIEKWTAANVVADYERMLEQILERTSGTEAANLARRLRRLTKQTRTVEEAKADRA